MNFFTLWPQSLSFSGILNTILGVPSECVHQNSVWPCKLSFSCWLQGGRHAKGCGANKWLFSCCIGGNGNTNTPNNVASAATAVQYRPYQGNNEQAPVINLVGNTLNEHKRQAISSPSGVGASSSGGGGGVLPKRVMLKRRNENDVFVKVGEIFKTSFLICFIGFTFSPNAVCHAPHSVRYRSASSVGGRRISPNTLGRRIYA